MIRKYFLGSFITLGFGLVLGGIVGWSYQPQASAAFEAVLMTALLALLEVSLSFDNAIVNAVVLREMTPIWQKRFLTWGLLIAVFGMRLVFPLAIVSVVGSVSPWAALRMAAFAPDRYAELMLSIHLQIAAFGGAFLMGVALKYFYDENKKEHWLPWIEAPLAWFGRIRSLEVAILLMLMLFISHQLPEQGLTFLTSGLAGLIVFVLLDGLGEWLENRGGPTKNAMRASAGLFVYLEVLDASFSFDGVVGAFAITHNLFIIMIGLGVGAFFVRSLTLLFVERQTLARFVYLEHGAFYAIAALATIMLFDPLWHTPEWVTGLVSAGIILASLAASARANPKGWSSPTKSE